MKDEHLKILKTMNEATNRMDLTMFAQAVGLTPNQAIAEVQVLAREGFLHKVGNGYGLTDKGRNAIKISAAVPAGEGFNFYVDIGKSLGFSAETLEQFYRQIRQVCSDSLEFHLYRGDFENWLHYVVKDDGLAGDFGAVKASELHGEDLRKALLQAIDVKYGVGELL